MQHKSSLQIALLFAALTANTSILHAQINTKAGNENSPYSYYGIGLLSNTPNAPARAMGGGAAAYNDEFTVNSSNPASYSFIRSTTLDIAFEAKNRTVTFENEPSVSSFTGSMAYINFAVPLKKYGGLAFGLKPISNAYYSQADTIDILYDKAQRHYGGSGNLQYGFIGLAGKIGGFSAGVNAGYAFGNMLTSQSINATNSFNLRNLESYYKANYSGFMWSIGAMYNQKFGKNNFINVGATHTVSQSLSGKRNGSSIMRTYEMGSDGRDVLINMDTITMAIEQAGTLELPTITSFGIHGGKTDKYEYMADVQLYDWTKFSNFNNRENIRDKSYRASAGFSFTPNINVLYGTKGSYLSAITYRVGFYTNNDYVIMRNTDIQDVGGTFGFSFPLRNKGRSNQFGKIHTTFAIGSRGTFDNGLARETYVNFTLAASLSDIWFIKPKYD